MTINFRENASNSLDIAYYFMGYSISAWHSLDLRFSIIFTKHPMNHTCRFHLIHWGRGKIAAIFQTTFSNAYSWPQMYEFRVRFRWSLFLRVQLTIFQHWFSQWLGADQATSHYMNQWWLVYLRIYASVNYALLGRSIIRLQLTECYYSGVGEATPVSNTVQSTKAYK